VHRLHELGVSVGRPGIVSTSDMDVAFLVVGVPWFAPIPGENFRAFIQVMLKHGQGSYLGQTLGDYELLRNAKTVTPIPRCDSCGKSLWNRKNAYFISEAKILCERCYRGKLEWIQALGGTLEAWKL